MNERMRIRPFYEIMGQNFLLMARSNQGSHATKKVGFKKDLERYLLIED